VLRHYCDVREALAGKIDLCLLAVGSEGEASRSICEGNGFAYVEHANDPVSLKWNAVIREARALEPEGVVLVNSDDLVQKNVFDVYLDRLDQGFDYFGLRGTHFFDLATLQVGTWPGYEASYMKYRIGEPAGCARCFSRKVLDSTGFRLWPKVPQKSSSMDFWCTQFVKLFGFEPEAWTMDELGVTAVQLKTDVNITTFDRMPMVDVRAGDAGWEVVGAIVDQPLVEALRELQFVLAPDTAASGGRLTYRYKYAGVEPRYRIEDLPSSATNGDTIALLQAMRESELGETS